MPRPPGPQARAVSQVAQEGCWPGQPGMCHAKENPLLLMKHAKMFVILKIQEVRVCRWQHTPLASHSTLQLLPTQGGSRAARPTVLMPTDARACWAGGRTALPAGGRRQHASAPLLQPFVRAARTCTGGERSGGPSFGVAGRSTGLFRWRIGQASCPQCPRTALRTNAIPPRRHSLNAHE